MNRALLPLLVLAILTPACGRKTPVKPPEFAAPERIDDLATVNQEGGIRLSWGRPREYADGSRMLNLGGFTVERRRPGGDFARVAELPISDRERFRQRRTFRYLDPDVASGLSYEYRVLSFTLDDYVSQPSNVVSVVRVVPTPEPAEPPASANPLP